MAGEWKTKRISDLGRVVTGKTPSTAVAENFGGNYPFITIPDMDGRREISTSARTLSEQGAQSLRTCRLPTGAVMMSCIATIGNCGITTRPSFTNQQINSLICGDDTDPKFVYYCFTQLGHALEAAGGGGSVYINVSKSRFEEIELTLPPLAEQKAIAAVLGALDDKIELNRRMNATLEAMARALFQSWFVDFDPVRAKLDGRPPANLDPATAALFPDSFDATAICHIPHGWEVKTLGEVIELAYGKPLKAEDRKNGSVCVYGANGPVGWHNEKLVSGPGIVVGRKGNPGVVTWAHGDFYPIDTTFYVELIGTCRSLYFFYYALSLHNLANLSADSAVPGLNRNHAYMSKQVIPSQSVLAAFDSQIAPIFTVIHANADQSRTLATLRDTLLPKLLSGELSVAEAQAASR
jgi:type I restriction enzyme, S subunit